jgi:DNA ligase (NAD+)
VKVSSLALHDALGVVGREPRWAIAYKFPAEQAFTRLLEIGINVGRTGSLNPYAVLEPVVVSGVTVRNASLHNEEDIHRKDIRVGDLVTIERAGDVIPHVLGPVLSERPKGARKYKMPAKCPVCRTAIVKPDDEAMHRCPNTSCPAQFSELLKHFVSKGAADIDGLGERWCQILIDQGIVTDLADLYTLTKDQLLQLDRMGDKLATRIMANIEASKQKPLPRLLFALGIIHVGSEVAELLTQAYNSIDEIAAATEEELAEIPGIGPKIAASIATYFQASASKTVIEKLRAAGVTLKQEPRQVSAVGPPLTGKTFVVTGTLSGFSRSESESRIKDLGGKVTSSVTRNTDYLVVGESPGSKLAAAERLGTAVLDETAFVELLANPPVEAVN